MFIVFTCGASQFDSYWFGFLFNHHKPPKKEKKRRNHHCPDEDARLRHLITVFVAGSKHASNWHLFPGCVDRHRRFVSMSHFTFSICPEAGLYIFLLTVCLHARGFILCVLTFHPHRKWSFPPQKLCSVFTCGQGKPGFWLAKSNLFTFIFFSSVRLCHTLSPLLVPLWLRLANICIQLGLESPPVDIKSFTPTLNDI